MIRVLVQSPVPHLGVVELTLHDVEHMLDLGPDLRLGAVALPVLVGE